MTLPRREELRKQVQERFIAYCGTGHDSDAERLAACDCRDAFAALAYELNEGGELKPYRPGKESR